MKIHKELEAFKERSKVLGLCDNYTDKWDSAQNTYDLIKLATDINGMPYILESLVDTKMGITTEFAVKFFGSYVNSDEPIKRKENDSKLFIDTECDITLSATINGFLNTKATLYVPEYIICHVYSVNSDLQFNGNGIVYCHKLIGGKWINEIIKTK